ncbi:Uncharacterized protein SCF082_LOCUS15178 [Durusdinium trenchii]|uniref:Uncharacterized protein n=1 Tax=Durusdinium trenchii TaxID=1381693 RepID=A0ABP0K2R9_9DINO
MGLYVLLGRGWPWREVWGLAVHRYRGSQHVGLRNIIGTLALTVALHRQPSIGHAWEEDRSDRLLETIRNGAHLHRTVAQNRWCVTLADLQQFKRLVFQAVRKGVIKPTERDQFLASDTRVGPSVYTVVDQFVKPMTRAAGNVSWALMKHPEGLLCDVFITHAWAEGIYEFVDKVTQSWPRGATAAYVCFLSYPQNLDISDLIQSPRESPFARALGSSRLVIAVPNHVCSIYSYIWCVYEAFLAFIWDKRIRAAKSPVVGWLSMLRVSCTAFATLGACILILMSQATYYGFTADFVHLVRQIRLVSIILSALCGVCIMVFFALGKHAWISCQIAILVFAVVVEMFVAADLCLNGATDPPVICVLLLSILACGAVEGDRRQSEAKPRAPVLLICKTSWPR